MTRFDAFLEKAWTDHGDHAEEVGQRLEEGYALLETPAQIAPFARILAHVDGEHLGRWTDGVARLERLRAHPQWRHDGDAATMLRRLIAALRFGNGEADAEELDAAERTDRPRRDCRSACRREDAWRTRLAIFGPCSPLRHPDLRTAIRRCAHWP